MNAPRTHGNRRMTFLKLLPAHPEDLFPSDSRLPGFQERLRGLRTDLVALFVVDTRDQAAAALYLTGLEDFDAHCE